MEETAAAFLRAIQAAPCDALPRLALADWLDEHGQWDQAEWLRQDVAVGEAWRTRQPLTTAAMNGGQPAGVEPLDMARILAGWRR